MKALAINGSPRKGGNTEILLRKVLEPLAAAGHQTDYLQVGGTRIQGCRACGACGRMKNKRCVIDDDVFTVLTVEGSLGSRNHIGGTSPEQVRAAIARARSRLRA